MATCEQFDKICKILSHYDPEDYEIFHKTAYELCEKGIAKGNFQDYTVLTDILAILEQCKIIIKNGEGVNQ